MFFIQDSQNSQHVVSQVCYVGKQGGLFMYRMIVYIAIALFTLEGISRNGHMKLPTSAAFRNCFKGGRN